MNRRALLAALAFALFALGWIFQTREAFDRHSFQYDFVAFYCGSSVALAGADPYRVEPLRACEHRVGHAFRADSKLVVPAPLPGYGFAFLAPLTKLPYPLAAALWFALTLASYGLCVVALARLTELSMWTCFIASALPIGFVSLQLGQIVPLAVAALTLAALALEARRPWLVAACLAVATLEPHLAFPAFAALFVLRSEMRVPLAVTGAALAALSLATLGLERNVEYVTRVLGAQVASELGNVDQLSLAAIAHRAGLALGAAVLLGRITYAFALVAGIALAARAARALRAPALLVILPPAIALLGAPYVHVHHLAAAVPAALFLAARSSAFRPAAWAVALLSLPWITPYDALPLLPLDALAFAACAYGLLRISPARAALLGAGAFAMLLLAHTFAVPHLAPPPSAYAGVAASDLAEAAWSILIDAGFRENALPASLLALPVWCALVTLVIGAARARLPASGGCARFLKQVRARSTPSAVLGA